MSQSEETWERRTAPSQPATPPYFVTQSKFAFTVKDHDKSKIVLLNAEETQVKKQQQKKVEQQNHDNWLKSAPQFSLCAWVGCSAYFCQLSVQY